MPARAIMVAWVLALVAGIVPGTTLAQTDDEKIALFKNEVRPLLEENCFQCHGGRKRVRGGFDMTTREGVLAGGFLGPAVDLETPGESLILAMTSYRDEDHQMPPSGKLSDEQLALLARWVQAGAPWDRQAPKPNTDPEIDLEEFATTRDAMAGWSYRPVVRPTPPAVTDAAWAENPVDAFIHARLAAQGLAPVGPASRVAWLRRATYDLIGLPPSPEEVEAFVADTSPGAKERVIDRLLDSPHYGERWGRHWLDVVRYAETNGYERDSDKPYIWRYRDYVVQSFNDDKPYDQFVREQIAGDELDEVTPETLVASGYNRLMLWDDEPGEGPLQGRYDVLADIVQTTGEAFLGMTLGCARCHDHKADPILQKDFYRFMGFFHGLSDMRAGGTLVPIPTPEEKEAHERAVAEKEGRIESLVAQIRDFESDFLARLAKQDDVSTSRADLVDLRYRFYRDTWNQIPDFDNLRFEEEGRLPHGYLDLSVATRTDAIGLVYEGQLVVPAEGTYRFEAKAKDGIRLILAGERVLEQDGVHDRPVDVSGTTTLSAGLVPFRLEYFNSRGVGALELSWEPAEARDWRYRFEAPSSDAWITTDFDDSQWASGRPGFGRPGTPGTRIGTEWTTSEIWLRTDFEWREGEELGWAFHHDEDLEVWINGTLALERGGFRQDYEKLEMSEAARRALRPGRNLLAARCRNTAGGQYVHVVPVPWADLARSQPIDAAFGRRSLSRLDLRSGTDIRELVKQRGGDVLSPEEQTHYGERQQELDRERKRSIPIREAFAATERPNIPDLHVHIRGSASSPGDKVEPGFPSVLADTAPVLPPPSDGVSSGRRRVLAEWLTRPDNPLTARVMVNRVWQHHFGRGLVPSPNDFGELGERPTHPDLLDWLASELVASGWSLKAMHRQIMTSRVYGLASSFDEASFAKDPKNDFFWRFDLRRLGAEELRDSILTLTGELNRRVGGPSFFEPLPPEVLATSSRPDAVWGKSPLEETRRRSLYIKVKRSLPVPILANFDLADTDASCPVRFETMQPTQALNLLNGEFIHGHARAFADRLMAEVGDDPSAQVELAWRLATSRRPSTAELEEMLLFRKELTDEFELSKRRVTELFCLLVFNLNEFVFLD